MNVVEVLGAGIFVAAVAGCSGVATTGLFAPGDDGGAGSSSGSNSGSHDQTPGTDGGSRTGSSGGGSSGTTTSTPGQPDATTNPVKDAGAHAVDTGTTTTPTPTIQCGLSTCNTALPVCCVVVAAGGLASSECVATNADCKGGIAATCTASTQCPGGKCCVSQTEAVCEPACTGESAPICNTNMTPNGCPAGDTCMGTGLDGYGYCLPAGIGPGGGGVPGH